MAALFYRVLLSVAFSTLLLTNATAQSLSWAQAINGVGSIGSTGVLTGTTDDAGNVYSVGYFGGTANFDRVGVFSLTAVCKSDMFIMKEDPSGNLIWVKQVKGLSSGVSGCTGSGIDIDRSGNVFITGSFRDSFDFDPGPAAVKLFSYGGYHSFILKLDASGNFVWVRDIGFQISSGGVGISASKRDREGYLFFSATVNGAGTTPLDVDPGPGVHNVTPGLGDLLLEKLDSNGNFVWAKLIAGTAAKQVRMLALDSSSNVVVSGAFLGSADFDPGPAVYTLTATPSVSLFYDFFVAKYDSAGNFIWAKSVGSGQDDEVSAGAVDRFGNVIVTGSYGGTVDFDPGPNVQNVTANSTRNFFTLRLTNNGDFSWVRTAPCGGTNYGRALATDDSGNVYTGVGSGGCDLDPGAGVFHAPSGAAVQKLDSSGNFVWGAGFGGTGSGPSWMGLDKDSIYITGSFTGANKDFDPGPGVFLLSGTGGSSTYSGFIAKLIQTPIPNSIEDVSLQTVVVSVYPNPSLGLVTFSSPSAIRRVEVTDMAGRVVYMGEPGSVKTSIDLGGKATGVYFYEVDCGGKEQRGKLVIY